MTTAVSRGASGLQSQADSAFRFGRLALRVEPRGQISMASAVSETRTIASALRMSPASLPRAWVTDSPWRSSA